jgi:hypothetical protein
MQHDSGGLPLLTSLPSFGHVQGVNGKAKAKLIADSTSGRPLLTSLPSMSLWSYVSAMYIMGLGWTVPFTTMARWVMLCIPRMALCSSTKAMATSECDLCDPTGTGDSGPSTDRTSCLHGKKCGILNLQVLKPSTAYSWGQKFCTSTRVLRPRQNDSDFRGYDVCVRVCHSPLQ